MNTPKAILIGFALVAAAVYFSRDVGPAQAASGGSKYSIVSAGNNLKGKFGVWVFSQEHGTVTLCLGDEAFTSREINSNCSLWHKAGSPNN